MANIVDYIKWRGDLPMTVAPINEIDNLILARIAYLPYEKVDLQERKSFEELAPRFLKLDEEDFHQVDDMALIKEAAKSVRFKDILFSDYVENKNHETEEQFAAVTVWLPNNELYVSYRGTDASIVGWKEDFNMSFMMHVPSQVEGVAYLEDIATRYKLRKIRVGGHSKGGNVAVYASIFCKPRIQNRIVEVINADGPGFDKTIIESEAYKEIVTRVHTFIPQDSVIGRLLEHEEKYKVVESIEKGIMQHDIYSWQVEGPNIIGYDSVTNGSEVVNEVVRSWLKNTTPEQRKNFINVVFDVINTTKVETVHDLSAGIVKNIGKIADTYKNIDDEEKKELKEIFKTLVKSSWDTLKEEYKKQ